MKNLLLVKTDAIGDYILFRNFIKLIKNSKQYKHHNIYLLCNSVNYELAKYLDQKYLQKIIPFNLNTYLQNKWYKYNVLNMLNQLEVHTIIQPTYSRNFHIDKIINEINANHKITFQGDHSNISKDNKRHSDKFYSKLISTLNPYDFEFQRNKEFWEKVLDKKLQIKKPKITITESYSLPFNNYIVLVIGANEEKRKWSINNYAQICNYINKEFDINIVILGTYQDLVPVQLLEAQINSKNTINLCGSTTLVETLHIIKQSLFIIANETGLVHMSLALNKKCFTISNGNHLGRFVPYPKKISKKQSVVFPFRYHKESITSYYNGSNLDINQITYNDFIHCFYDEIKKVLRRKVTSNTFTFEHKPINNPNLDFSKKVNEFYQDILTLKNLNLKFVIYGNGVVGKMIYNIMPGNITAFIDKNSIENPPSKLLELEYDKIIVSVLGREKEIVSCLINDLNIKKDKIIILQL